MDARVEVQVSIGGWAEGSVQATCVLCGKTIAAEAVRHSVSAWNGDRYMGVCCVACAQKVGQKEKKA